MLSLRVIFLVSVFLLIITATTTVTADTEIKLPLLKDCTTAKTVLHNHVHNIIPFSRCALLFSDRTVDPPSLRNSFSSIAGRLFEDLMDLKLPKYLIEIRNDLAKEMGQLLIFDNPNVHLKNLIVYGRFAKHLGDTNRTIAVALEYNEDMDPTKDYENIADMRAGITDHQKRLTSLKFTIGALFYDLKEYTQSMDFYAAANKEVSSRIEGKRMTDKYLDFFRTMRNAHPLSLFKNVTDPFHQQHSKLLASICPDQRCTFTFIIGFPRSGTTLMESLLTAALQTDFSFGEIGLLRAMYMKLRQFQLDYADEGTDIDFEEINFRDRALTNFINSVRGNGDVESRDLDGGGKHIIVKNCFDVAYAYLVPIFFPSAKIIFVSREFEDIRLSNFFLNFGNIDDMSYAFDLDNIDRYFYGYSDLVGYWESVFDKDTTIRVRYEDLVENTAQEMSRIVAALGYDKENNTSTMMSIGSSGHLDNGGKSSHSKFQVRQPITKERVGFWKNFIDVNLIDSGNT